MPESRAADADRQVERLAAFERIGADAEKGVVTVEETCLDIGGGERATSQGTTGDEGSNEAGSKRSHRVLADKQESTIGRRS
jgi:hypothetical protein